MAFRKATKTEKLLNRIIVLLGITALGLTLVQEMKDRVPTERTRRAGEALREALRGRLRKKADREEDPMPTGEDSPRPEEGRTQS